MLGWNKATEKEDRETMEFRNAVMAASSTDHDVCEGNVQLEITSFESFRQIDKCTRYLGAIDNLRIVSESWSEEDGLKIIVSVEAPLALAGLLEDIPEVERVYFNGRKSSFGFRKGYSRMVVEMKSTEPVREAVLV
jgi:hypothetical protein